jgi:hypothetical protein
VRVVAAPSLRLDPKLHGIVRLEALSSPTLLVRCQVRDEQPRGTYSRLADKRRLSIQDLIHPESAGLRGDGLKAEKVRFASVKCRLVRRSMLIPQLLSFSDSPASGIEIYRLVNQGSLTIWCMIMSRRSPIST